MVSVIVPVFQEGPRLPGFLDHLRARAAEAEAEIVVVDGGSTDGSPDAVREAGLRLVRSTAGRGRQMNRGVSASHGSLLAFVPADCRLPEGAVRTLDAIDRAGEPEAGGFRVAFDAPRRLLALAAALHNLRARVTGVFYLDQVPFVRRRVFVSLGGFRESAMEDVEFGTRLRSRVRARPIGDRVVTSARRFDRHGDLRTIAEAARLLLLWTVLRRVGRSRIFFDPNPAGPGPIGARHAGPSNRS